jgi:hypothetical protein
MRKMTDIWLTKQVLGLGKFSLAQLGALSSVYSHFQAATMDCAADAH